MRRVIRFVRRWKYTITTAVFAAIAVTLIVLRAVALDHYHLPWWLL